MVDFLRHTLPNAKFFVCGEQPLIDDLRAGGFSFSTTRPRSTPSSPRSIAPSSIQNADRLRCHPRRGAFFATNADRYCPVPGGGQPDAASIIAAIEDCTNLKCEAMVGKPSIYMTNAILNLLQLPPNDVS